MLDQDQKNAMEESLAEALGPTPDAALIERLMAAIQKNSFYSVIAVREYHDRDRDNYPRSRYEDSMTLRAETIDELCEKMAEYKIARETPEDEVKRRHHDGYYTIDFGTIEHILGALEWYDDWGIPNQAKDRLKDTRAWMNHEAKLKTTRAAAEENAKAAAHAAAQKIEEAERAQLAALLAKHGAPK